MIKYVIVWFFGLSRDDEGAQATKATERKQLRPPYFTV